MVKEMIQWRPVIIGTAIAVILYFVSYLLEGMYLNLLFLSTLPLMFGGILVGYMVGGDIKNGTFNGTIMGFVVGIINLVLMVVMIMIEGGSMAIISAYVPTLIIYFVIQIIFAAAGGVFGSMVRAESELERFPAEESE